MEWSLIIVVLLCFMVSQVYALGNTWYFVGGAFGVLCALLLLLFDAVAIEDVLKSTLTTKKKILWTLFILLVPVVGVLIYW
jgi:hypothetical protein